MSTDASLEDLVAQEQAVATEETLATPPPSSSPPSDSEPDPELDTGPATETPIEEPPPSEAAPPEGEESDEDVQLLDRMDRLTGYHLSNRYTSPDEALRGLGEALKLLGQRDDDAKFARTLRERYGDNLETILAKVAEPPPAKDERSAAPLPESYEAFDAIRNAALTRSKEPGFEGDPSYQRGIEATRAMERQTFETVRGFGALKEEVEGLRKQLTDQHQAHQATTSEQAEAGWWEGHKAEMAQGGDYEKDLSPLGKRTLKIAQTHEHCRALAETLGIAACLEDARDKALASQPKPKATKPVSPHAVHQPGVAPSEHRSMTQEELTKTDLDGEALLKALVEAGPAKG